MYDINTLITADTPTSELVRLYNETAERLGNTPITKFSDRATAEKRTRFALSQINLSEGGAAKPKEQPVPATETQKEAAKAAIKANKEVRTPAVKTSLPIASDNKLKDAEMPALRRVLKPITLNPKFPVRARKVGTAQALLVDLLSRPLGATFGELYDALSSRPKTADGSDRKPWRGVTIRSGIAWDMNHVAGYGIRTDALTGEEFSKAGRKYEADRLGFGTPAYDPNYKLHVYHLTYPNGQTGPVAHTERATKPVAAPKAKKGTEEPVTHTTKEGEGA